MRNILYWAPCLDKVATITAVLSSAKSVNKYYSTIYKVSILNIIGEWNNHYTKKTYKLEPEPVSFIDTKIFKVPF